jgi:hypothetical protein
LFVEIGIGQVEYWLGARWPRSKEQQHGKEGTRY